MKLYLLERDQTGHDQNVGILIRARNEQKAREIAAKKCGDEGSLVWLNNSLSTCKEIGTQGASEAILTSKTSSMSFNL